MGSHSVAAAACNVESRRLTKDEAISTARMIAEENDWPWRDPVRAVRGRAYVFFGAERWTIRTSADSVGMNVRVVLDDRSGEVLEKAFIPR